MTAGRSPSIHCAATGVLVLMLLAACSGDDPMAPLPTDACLTSEALFERIQFASVDQASEILGDPDPFVQQLSSFDVGARRQTLEPTTLDEFLQFASTAALSWTPTEQAGWKSLARKLGDGMEGLNVELPDIMLVKTNGREEFNAAYTRGRAIVFPARWTALPETDPRGAFFLLAHELFHVLSREDPALRDDLYKLMGFERFEGFDYPPELEDRRLSNPDAFRYEHALPVETESGTVSVVPVNQSTVPLEEAIELQSILDDALGILLIPVDTNTGDVLRDGGGTLVTYNFDNTDWASQMLRNSSYIIHPEEVLAGNFALLMEWRATGALAASVPGGGAVNDVGLLTAIEAVLTAGCSE